MIKILKKFPKMLIPAVAAAALIACCFYVREGRADAPAAPAAGQLVSMNFQNTDIKQILNFIRDITGKTIVADEKVKGNVTIIARDKMPMDEALRVLNSALKAKGFTLVTTADVTRVVPLEESKESNVETHFGKTAGDVADDDMVITQVVSLDKVSATLLRTDLKSLVGASGEILNNEGSNSLIITDTAANIKRLLKILDYLDHESITKSQIKVYALDYASAPEVATLLSQLPKNTDIPVKSLIGAPKPGANDDSTPVQINGELTVLPDARSNSIVVVTAPSNFPAIEKILAALDSMLAQVLIEVVIMEVTLSDTTQMGMEWYFQKAKEMGGETYTASSHLNFNLSAQDLGLQNIILRPDGAVKFLNFMLASNEKINILSTPMIMTTDNKQASIQVGSEVPYLKETRQSTGDTKDYVYDYRDVGIGLKVTPHINEQRYVVLDIHQEIKKLGAQTLFDAYIIISRSADASVVVKDRNTVILGGLMEDTTTKSKSKVPLLGDLPLLGQAFRTTSTDKEKTELLVFITPYIVTSADEVKQITEEHRRLMQGLPQ